MTGHASDEEKVDRWVARYPPAEISPEDFEQFVADVLGTGSPGLAEFEVRSHEVLRGVDGDFDFDATVRFSYLGMSFLTVVEAKRHSNPIKRELVQVLHSKAQSVGAQKAILISTAPFQRGAIEFAKSHGIALVMVSEGRFTFETRAASPQPPMSRQQARDVYGAPPFVGVCFGPAERPGATAIMIVNPGDAERIRGVLFGVQSESGSV